MENLHIDGKCQTTVHLSFMKILFPTKLLIYANIKHFTSDIFKPVNIFSIWDAYLFFPQYLFEVLEPNALDGVDHHPEQGQGGPYQHLALLSGSPHIEHDVACTGQLLGSRKLKLRNVLPMR